jgi:hypothetical protein
MWYKLVGGIEVSPIGVPMAEGAKAPVCLGCSRCCRWFQGPPFSRAWVHPKIWVSITISQRLTPMDDKYHNISGSVSAPDYCWLVSECTTPRQELAEVALRICTKVNVEIMCKRLSRKPKQTDLIPNYKILGNEYIYPSNFSSCK